MNRRHFWHGAALLVFLFGMVSSLARAGEPGALLRTLEGHEGSVLSVDFSPDGKTLVSGSRDGTIRFWDPQTGQEKAVLKGHTGDIETVAVSPNGRLLASSSHDTTVRIWDVGSARLVRTLEGHTEEVDSVGFSPDGKRVVSGCKDK